MKKGLKLVSVLLTVVLLLSVFVTPVAAGRENDRGQERQVPQQIQYLDAEVKVIDGQPVLRYETEDGYADIPFDWPTYALSDNGQKVVVERQGDAILLPAEDGLVAVPLKDFCVVMMGGQVKLLAEVNLVWKLIPAVIGIALKAKLISALATAGIKARVTFHFVEKVFLENISISNVITVLTTGQRLIDTKTGDRVIYHSGLRIAVIMARNSNVLITIYRRDVNKVKPWIAQNWRW